MFGNISEYYIMGCGALGKYLREFFANKNNTQFLGYLDNNVTGDNIYNPESADKNKAVIIGSINYMYEMTNQLKKIGFKNIIDFAKLTLEYPELQNYNKSFLGLKDDYEKNKDKYTQARKMFADEKSRFIFDKIIEYRKTYDINLYSQIADSPELQYCDMIAPRDTEVLIDGGAFDGDTILRMLDKGFAPKKIYFFEPDKTSLMQAKINLKNIKNIEFFPYGLSDNDKTLKFISNNSFSSHFSEVGDSSVKCVALDNIVKEKKAFIKLDIEGAEYDAIMGAKRLFENHSPFAICVYHKPEDLWKIPDIIQKLSNNAYKLYLRHYTTNVLETVLYGVTND